MKHTNLLFLIMISAALMALLTVTCMADNFELWVSGVQVTTSNASDILGDGTAKFDDESLTLKLNGLTNPGTYKNAQIFSRINNLTITGTAELNSSATYGIDAKNLIFDNANIYAAGESYGIQSGDTVVRNNSNITATTNGSGDIGLYSIGNLTIENSTVTANNNQRGIFGSDLTISNSTVTAINNSEFGISFLSIFINSGNVTAYGDMYGLHAIYTAPSGNVSGSLLIRGGTVNATSDTSGYHSDSCGIYVGSNIRIEGDSTNITAKGAYSAIRSAVSYINISGGSVYASGGDYGLIAHEKIEISGDDTFVDAKGYFAIASDDSIEISSPLSITTPAEGVNKLGIIYKSDAVTHAEHVVIKRLPIITWKNDDGSILKTDTGVDYGTMPTYTGTEPEKPEDAQYKYTFNGWTPAISSVVGDAVYTAVYTSTLKTYTVTWKDDEGTVLETDFDTAYGTVPTYDGPVPTKAPDEYYTYTFSGWSPAVSAVSGDDVYTAVFDKIPVTVIGISIEHPADKTNYAVGDSLDVKGLTIKADYSNGTSKTITVTVDMVSGFDSSAAVDCQTLTITFEGQTTTYDIKISKILISMQSFLPVLIYNPVFHPDHLEDLYPETPKTPEAVQDKPADTEPDETELLFTDVTADDKFYDDVLYVYKNGLMAGVSDDSFDPDGTLTRAMIVTILYRAEGQPEVNYTGSFDDVTEGIWYTDGVEWAAENDIVKGYGDRTFGHSDPVTKEQLAAILNRYAEYKGYDTVHETITVDGETSDWAVDSVMWALIKDIIGQEENYSQPALRYEVAKAIHAFILNAEITD